MAQNYYQKEIETMPLDELKKLQSEKIIKQVKHVYENVAYYRNLMDEKGVKPEDIKSVADLSKPPFTYRQDLRDNYPFGLFAGCLGIHGALSYMLKILATSSISVEYLYAL